MLLKQTDQLLSLPLELHFNATFPEGQAGSAWEPSATESLSLSPPPV